ncbi:hypothetical protein GC176_12380 [bacterium]|nr:hypothetical protein [bacterium]
MTTLRFLLTLALVSLIPEQGSAVDLTPGTSHRYRVTRTVESTTKILGTTVKSKEVYSREINAVVGQKNADGLTPVTLNVTRVSGEAPKLNFDTLKLAQTNFDTKSWDGQTAPPTIIFLPLLAQMKKPLNLWFSDSGKLESATGSKEIAKEAGVMLERMFRSDPAFENAKSFYKSGYVDSVRQWVWKDRLILTLPEDFELGSEWEQKDVRTFHHFYVYVNGKFAAVDESADGTEIEASYDIPATGEASTEYGNHKYVYSAKNGTGEGKLIVRPDGWLHKADTTLHAYFDVTLHSGPTTVTVAGMTISVGPQSSTFDDYYVRTHHKVERLSE